MMLSCLNNNVLNTISNYLTFKERCILSKSIFPYNCNYPKIDKYIDYKIQKLYYKIVISEIGYEIYNKYGILIDLDRLKDLKKFNIQIKAKLIIDFKSILYSSNYNSIIGIIQDILDSNIIIYKISIKKYIDTWHDIYYLFYEKIYNILNILDHTKIKSFTIKNSNWEYQIDSLNWRINPILIRDCFGDNNQTLKDEKSLFFTSKFDFDKIKKFNNLKKIKIKDCYIESLEIDSDLIKLFSNLKKIELVNSHFLKQTDYTNFITLIENNKIIKKIHLGEVFIRDIDIIHWKYDVKTFDIRYNSLTKLIQNLNFNNLEILKINVSDINSNNDDLYLDDALNHYCIDNNIDFTKINLYN